MLNVGDRTSKYVKIWDVEDKGNYVKGRIGSSSKDKEGNYKNSNWFATFVGQAKEKAESLSKGDVIEITNGGVENIFSKEKEREYLNVVIFDFEMQDEMTF